MLPSASYWRPWSSKAWESSWPITTPIAPEDFHNNQSSPFSISEIDDDSLSVEFELSLSMKVWIWPKLRLGGLAMLKKGACKIPAGKAICVRLCVKEILLHVVDVVFWKPGCWEACSRRWWWTGSSPTLSGRPALRAFSGSLATPTGWTVQQ